MAFKNDYIMRLIEQLGVVIARIIYLKRNGQYDEAEAALSRAAQNLLGFDMALLRRLTDEGIAELLRRPDPSDVGQLLAAAELLREQGEIDAQRGGPDTDYDCNHKALSLYLECYLHAADLTAKVAALVGALRPYFLPVATRRKLAAYYERAGDFAQAENLTHLLMEDGAAGAWEDGLAFYARLAARSDEELAAGGLPRDEMEEGHAAFQELR